MQNLEKKFRQICDVKENLGAKKVFPDRGESVGGEGYAYSFVVKCL